METSYHYKLVEKAIWYISENHLSQPDLEGIANHVNLSKFHFQRLFQKWAGVSPKQFLKFITVQHAKECLAQGRSTLETTYEVGLSGNGRLHDLFVDIEACTPGEFQKKGKDITVQYDTIDSPFGKVLVAETKMGISQLLFLDGNTIPREVILSEFPYADLSRALGKFGKLVQRYFNDWKTPKEKIILNLKGTPFQIKVWKALLSIPSSQLLSYGDIARHIGNPNAMRAVGTAIGKNPAAYLIPCHRVIHQTGEIGGYRWGSKRKTVINGYESVLLSNKRIA